MQVDVYIATTPSNDASTTSPLNPDDGWQITVAGGQPEPTASTKIELKSGEIVVVVGPNGVGKSSLLAELARAIGQGKEVETFFGNRAIGFQNEDIDQLTHTIESIERQLAFNISRFRNPLSEQHLKVVLKRLANAEAQVNSDLVDVFEQGGDYEAATLHRARVLKTLNRIFDSAHLPISIVTRDGALRARRGELEYGVDRLSDGERAALLVVSAVITRPPDTFIVIDEPERHLNPGISGPLLSALFRARPDVGFIISTHEMNLVEWLKPAALYHVKNSRIINHDPETREYDLRILEEPDAQSDDVRLSLLGGRKRLLLVEGTITSEDRTLYGQLYPEWDVVAKGGCDSVIQSVRSLNRTGDRHWLKAAGIIDSDGRGDQEQGALRDDSIYALPVPTIENLFLLPTVASQMAEAAYRLKGGKSPADRMVEVRAAIPTLLEHAKPDIVNRRVAWEADRMLAAKKPSVAAIRDGLRQIEMVDLEPIIAKHEENFELAIVSDDILEAASKLPIKNTRVPNEIARMLGFSSFVEYKQAVLTQLEQGSSDGEIILGSLRDIMPHIILT